MPHKHMPRFLQDLWSTSLGMCIIDNQAYIYDANLAFSASLGHSSRDLIGRDMALLLAQGSGSKRLTLRKQFTDKRYTITQGIWRLPTEDDRTISLCVLGSWITKYQGQLYKSVATINAACREEGQALLESNIFKADTASASLGGTTTTHTTAHVQASDDDAQQTISRLQTRVDELEGKVAAYRAILERYKASGDVTANASSWNAKLGKD